MGKKCMLPGLLSTQGKPQGHCQNGRRQTLRSSSLGRGTMAKGEQDTAARVRWGGSALSQTEAAAPKGNLPDVGLEVPIGANQRPNPALSATVVLRNSCGSYSANRALDLRGASVSSSANTSNCVRKPLCNADSKQSRSGKMIYNLQKEGRLWVLLEVSVRSIIKHLKGVSPVVEGTWKSPSRAPRSPCGVSLGHILNA